MRGYFRFITSTLVVLQGCAPTNATDGLDKQIPSDPFSGGISFNTVDPARAFVVLEGPQVPAPGIDLAKPMIALPHEFLDDAQIVGGDVSGKLVELMRVPVGEGPRDIAALDFNGDGHIDLVTADTGGSTLTLLGKNPNGTFEFSSTVSLATTPHHLATFDLNGDGQDELIVSVGLDAQGGLSVFSAASGTLMPLGEFFPLAGATRITAGDLDADGIPELAVVYSGGLALLHNDGGNLSLLSSFSPCTSPWSAVIADFDGNGRGDIAVACRNEAKMFFDPILGPDRARSLGPTGQLYDLVVVDFDQNGTLDIAAADVTEHQMQLWLSPAVNADTTPISHLVHRGPVAIGAVDFERDGDTDLLVLAYEQRTLEILENKIKE